MNINCVMGTLLGNLSGASSDVINIHKLSNESVREKNDARTSVHFLSLCDNARKCCSYTFR